MTTVTRFSDATQILADARAGADAIMDAAPTIQHFEHRMSIADEARMVARHMTMLADVLELRLPTRESV